ncbi:Flavin-containing monooxygenase [Hyphodiscus hymeniophilus]|uniref:Flavin-containing monooxygenase n=1 Tax=Hyphodiscus hymeniophilus TaxID=353542 RepID=A0A9P6VEM9_9HELO|nr:Flavin-containing monooxygenase [Hyphodiscus hymeniophilus]
MIGPPPTPYPTRSSLAFSQVPGSLPGDVVPKDIDLSIFPSLGQEFLSNLKRHVLSADAIWRDFFALTGQLRTFNGAEQVFSEWDGVLLERDLGEWKMENASVCRMAASISWVDVSFTFSVEKKCGRNGESRNGELRRNCFGIVSFVPDGGGKWKVWMLRTMLENFEGFSHPDDPSAIFSHPVPRSTPSSSEEELEFDVIVIGAGQCGLSLAGRLGALGIEYLLLEKEAEVGRSWTGKYDSVRQHTVREMNNLPFERTYKADDPTLLPAKTVAEGYENYAEKYRINVWLGVRTERCVRKDEGWELNVRLRNETRVLRTKHLALSLGGGASVPNPPFIVGRGHFKDDVLNIGEYKNCHPWKGKKGVVVGSGTGAHDVAQDMLDAGLKAVTMVQRSKTPVYPVDWVVQGQSMMEVDPESVVYNTEIPPSVADRLVSLLPLKIERELMKVNMNGLIAANPERFDALEKVGFRVDREVVLTDSILLRGGGYYVDVGTSKHIAEGDIKIKSGVKIERFTQNGLKFEDGQEIDADLVVFATGYERDIRLQAAGIVGHEIAASLPQARVLTADGEVSGPMTPSAERLWVVRGAVSEARFQSRFIALQIQAALLGKPLPDCQWGGLNGTHKSSS